MEVIKMANQKNIQERAQTIGKYVAEKGVTVREAAKIFGVSKSTVHKDLTERLPKEHPGLYEKVAEVLTLNKGERHIRGGEATRRKYQTLGGGGAKWKTTV
jgi:putative DeoR family transcriptional regulator (stage III sporulation protein D)